MPTSREAFSAGSLGVADYDYALIGRRVAAHRQFLTLSQAELAKAIRVSTRTIAQLEIGESEGVRFETIGRLARYFGITIDELTREEDQL